MGSFEEEGELPARAPARGAVRSLHVHVPTARAWRLQVGQGADPGVRHLRRVQAPAAILTRATSLKIRDRLLKIRLTGAEETAYAAEASAAALSVSAWARRCCDEAIALRRSVEERDAFLERQAARRPSLHDSGEALHER